MNAQFRANLFRVDSKIMQNFVQKSHFVQKRETVAQENLLHRGNPNTRVLPFI